MIRNSLSVQSIIETHDQPFLLFDREQNIVAVNSSLEKNLGLSRDQLLGRNCHEFLYGQAASCGNDPEADCPLCDTLGSLESGETIRQFTLFGERPVLCQARTYPVEAADKTLYIALTLTMLGSSQAAGDQYDMIGSSPIFQAMQMRLSLCAKTDTPVLIHGESGTGKELAAEFVHRHSARSSGPFVTVDCTVLGEQLFESQLFGHVKGSFTGSAGTKKGLYEMANGGTLFLDEIGEIPLAMQPKLLRALESNSFRRVGGNNTITSDVRVVCATNRELLTEVTEGRFRQDLYYRLAVFPVQMPTLRERQDDIPLLVEHFLNQLTSRTGQVYEMSGNAMDCLMSHDFPGNVRELRNLIQLASALSLDGLIGPDHIQINQGLGRGAGSAETVTSPTEQDTDGSYIENMEARYIADLLENNGGSRRKVAAIMGISERTLYRKIKKYSL